MAKNGLSESLQLFSRFSKSADFLPWVDDRLL